MAWKTPVPEISALPAPTPAPRRYRCRLDTIAEVKRELQRVYRESRSNLISVESASKWAHILSIVGRLTVDNEIEARLAALEAQGEGK